MLRRTLINLTTVAGIIITSLSLSHCGNISGLASKDPYKTKKSDYWNHRIRQDDVWSCHAFCAVGLLEAAYQQQYGKKINLSEANVMIHHLKGNHQDWDSAFRNYLLSSTKTSNPRHLEAGQITESFKLIQRYGVAYEKEVGYESGMGFPLAIRVMRQNFDQTRKLIKSNQLNRKQLIAAIEGRKTSIIKNGNLKYFKKAERPLSSRAHFKNFANQYSIQTINHKLSRSKIIAMLKSHPVAIQFTEPSMNFSHIVIFEKYNANTNSFNVRNSDTQFYFSKKGSTPDTMIRKMDAAFYLRKK